MASKWRKAKLLLGLKTCLYLPQTLEDPSPSGDVAGGSSPEFSTSSSVSKSTHRLSLTGPKSSTKTCAICLNTMKRGQGHAIFTAECSHTFHFHCISSNVKHGNKICPVCRAKWKEVPFQSPVNVSQGRPRPNPVGLARADSWMTVLRRLPPALPDTSRLISPFSQATEPGIFNDDEALEQLSETTGKNISVDETLHNNSTGGMEVKTYVEVSAVPKLASNKNFYVLIHLKAPLLGERRNNLGNRTEVPSQSQSSRVPVDLVTVLDVSGSMAGTKLALLKRAMGFVIQNLGASDRLSVIAFSSTACRLFPLRRMTDIGRQEALQAVNLLVSKGGTNIAQGLRKAAKVIVERKLKNPVASIMLLSDGQDTYMVTSPQGPHPRVDYQLLVPISSSRNGGEGCQIPVHAFGFGADHDSVSMHSISEISGGTFSFIESEGAIQDAFAQCIGGLLSVVVQEVRLKVDCVNPFLRFESIKAGSYRTSMTTDGRTGTIDVGDLYAEEERNFLVAINIPVDESSDELSLMKIRCIYTDPISKQIVIKEESSEVKIQRPEMSGHLVVSMEVERQRNRLQATEAMAEARSVAEHGDLADAVTVLESCHMSLSETNSAKNCDRLCIALCAELKEMQERMANRCIYETSGRAYVLSGLSSHSWQRATARGDSTDSSSIIQAYQTPSMINMVTQSQTLVFENSIPQRALCQALSFPATRSRGKK